MGNNTLDNGLSNCYIQPTPQVCPTCGKCPTCGNQGWPQQPYVTWTTDPPVDTSEKDWAEIFEKLEAWRQANGK